MALGCKREIFSFLPDMATAVSAQAIIFFFQLGFMQIISSPCVDTEVILLDHKVVLAFISESNLSQIVFQNS